MELPKNITQIGMANGRCKIYIEDYVISYIKQLNHAAGDKNIAVALYGVRREENEVAYLFLYGACKLNFLQKECRHLSQAQQQEIERLRVKHFGDYSFLGYRLLNGEMIEGFHVCEQGICRYVEGYAQFYEKNDSMLAYMLDARKEVPPETVDLEKYETVKRRQEERRSSVQDDRKEKEVPVALVGSANLRGMRVAVVAVFALLCIVGLGAAKDGAAVGKLQDVVGQLAEGVTEQHLPDATQPVPESVAIDSIVAEDKLAEAILQENNNLDVVPVAAEPVAEPVPSSVTEEISQPEPEVMGEEIPVEESVAPEEPVTAEQATAEQVVSEPISYIIQKGDTLIDISMLNYGTDTRVQEICTLNQIDNPDDIKVGQKILLP